MPTMNLAAAASAAILALTGYLVAGLALQHAAYILQYGSVFDSARRWLERKACSTGAPRRLRWLCSHVRELVACQLCSITQLAIWFCALPVTAAAVELGGARPLGLSPALGAMGLRAPLPRRRVLDGGCGPPLLGRRAPRRPRQRRRDPPAARQEGRRVGHVPGGRQRGGGVARSVPRFRRAPADDSAPRARRLTS